jgi:hypothetical protein
MSDCWFDGNDARGAGGGGGLLVVDSVLAWVERSAFTGNLASLPSGVGGGARLSRVDALLDRVTLSGNAADSSGGGLYLSDESGTSLMRIRSSTLAGNRSDADGDGVGDGAAFRLRGEPASSITLRLANTLVATNDSGPVAAASEIVRTADATLVSDGFNLLGMNAGVAGLFPAGQPNGNFDYVGTAASPLDPRLGALDLHGGTTPSRTLLRLPDSIAIDAGLCADEPGDQRGFGVPGGEIRARNLPLVPNGPGSDGCDIGAHEVNGEPTAPSRLFVDGFEAGHALVWTNEAP